MFDEWPGAAEQHPRWRDYVWKRPKEVYGEGNYKIYKKIGPEDIM